MQAACPNCGARVLFRFEQAVQTTCEFCHSILVRSGLDLRLVGKVADLPPNMSPVQLGTEGIYQHQAFWVTGRIIYQYEHGNWNEWHVAFQNGTSGWLSDAQAQYAVSRRIDTPPAATDPTQLYAGSQVDVAGVPMQVTSLTRAHYAGVEGELPFEYWDKSEVLFIDLRSSDNRFATFDYSESPPIAFLGESVEFASLALTNLRDTAREQTPGGAAQALNCPNCGGAIELRAPQGQTVSAVCIQCLSILDATDNRLQVIQQFAAAQRVEPLIPLGKTAKLAGGEVWQNIGFQVRSVTVEGERYPWHEYVLFNEFRGFRYLTQYNGHWNDVKPVTTLPTQSGGKTATWMNETFKHFQTATAVTDYVMGEFPWRVRVGETAVATDYVLPPRMLSSERYEGEITWSIGEYVAGAEIWKMFGLPGEAPPAKGVYANQPSPHKAAMRTIWSTAAALILLVLVSLLVAVMATSGKTVLERNYTYTPGLPGEASFVTPVFELDGRASNVEVDIFSDVDNNWVYFNLALINEATGQAWDWGREVSYYSGRDSDGAWSEGSRKDSSRVGHVPPGRYYLRIEPERTDDVSGAPLLARGAQTVHYGIRVRRDVVVVWPYLVGILLLIAPPLFKTFQYLAFEGSRWNESDHSSSGDD